MSSPSAPELPAGELAARGCCCHFSRGCASKMGTSCLQELSPLANMEAGWGKCIQVRARARARQRWVG